MGHRSLTSSLATARHAVRGLLTDGATGSRSFSQSGEDMIISFVFDAMGVERPSYLDIGAHHPTHLSNTARLYANGSRGINVEPDPSLIDRFVVERPRDINLNIGIALDGPDGELPFFLMDPPTLNTFSELEAKSYVAEGYRLTGTTTVRVESVQRIVDQHAGGVWPDLLSIDVEGLDFEILESAEFGDDGPMVICAETITFSASGNGVKRPEIGALLEERGYFLYADTHINSIFVKRSAWTARTGERARRLAKVADYIRQPAAHDPYLRSLFAADRPLVVFDIGACEGEDSIRYGRMFPSASVFAFEPLPSNLELVDQHLREFRASNVTVVPLALSEQAGEATFHVSSGQPDGAATDDWDFGNKSSSLLPPERLSEVHPWLSFGEQITVPTDTIDRVVAERGLRGVDFIHMDVQGAELMVLRGASATLRHITAIWLEVEAAPLYKDQPLKHDVERFMRDHGFVKVLDAVDGVAGDQLYVNRALVPAPRIAQLRLLRASTSTRKLARRSVGAARRRVTQRRS